MVSDSLDSKYDVIIIGAGISGLICGNYLAKAGLKTLILEQHYLPGGCASSFKKSGFVFDSGAHSIGSCRAGGQFYRVLNELGLEQRISIRRARPSDSVMTDSFLVNLGSSLEEDVEQLSKLFPKYGYQIGKLFSEIEAFDINSPTVMSKYLRKYRDATFSSLLDSFFSDTQLREVFCAFLGNAGLSSNRIGAIPALSMFREFVFDGGYYVPGGMGAFMEQLVVAFRAFGGTICFSTRVARIIVNNGSVRAVATEGQTVNTEFVVSTGSPRQTFLELVGRDDIPKHFATKVEKLRGSVSAFIVYLGVRGPDVWNPLWGRTVWYSPGNCSDRVYEEAFEGKVDEQIRTLLVAFPSRFDASLAPPQHSSLHLFIVAPFMTTDYWRSHKEPLMEAIIDRAGEIIPSLKQRIVIAEAATPATIYRYTLNDEGSMYGLASLASQYSSSVMPQRTCVEGLFLASHWATVGGGQGGTPMAAFAGRNAAKMLLSRLELRGSNVSGN